MTQQEKREDLFDKWREAKDNEFWVKCDNCAKDLLSTLDESLPVKVDLQNFYNQINGDVGKEIVLLKEIQNNSPPLKRERYDSLYRDIDRWWANELYNEFYKVFKKESLIKSG